MGFPLVLASSTFGSTRVCTELEAQGSTPFFQRGLLGDCLGLDLALALFLFRFKI